MIVNSQIQKLKVLNELCFFIVYIKAWWPIALNIPYINLTITHPQMNIVYSFLSKSSKANPAVSAPEQVNPNIIEIFDLKQLKFMDVTIIEPTSELEINKPIIPKLISGY